MADYFPPDARIFDADFDWEAAASQDLPPVNPIAELARAVDLYADLTRQLLA